VNNNTTVAQGNSFQTLKTEPPNCASGFKPAPMSQRAISRGSMLSQTAAPSGGRQAGADDTAWVRRRVSKHSSSDPGGECLALAGGVADDFQK